jgi:hypothetical protein
VNTYWGYKVKFCPNCGREINKDINKERWYQRKGYNGITPFNQIKANIEIIYGEYKKSIKQFPFLFTKTLSYEEFETKYLNEYYNEYYLY